MDNFIIKNELLYGALWGDCSCKKKMDFSGYVYLDKHNLGRAFIEYCICRLFNIHRLPGCGYDRFCEAPHKFATLTEMEISEACDELKALYEYTQKRLYETGKVKDGYIELVRSLRDFEKKEVASQLEDSSCGDILLPVNVFTSYAHDGIESNYPGELHEYQMNIIRKIDVRNILLWDDFVSYYRNNDDCDRLCCMGDGEAEVLVISKSINGWETIERNCFKYTHIPSVRYVSSRPILEHEIQCGNSAPFEPRSGYIRPCDCDDFLTRFVMHRNQNKYAKINKITNEND